MHCLTRNVVKISGSGISRVLFNVKVVKQDSILSPKLFAIFIDDLAEYLEKRLAQAVHLGNKVLSLPLFAGDIALFARPNSVLQTLLYLSAEYLEEKKLEINTKKIEVMIFAVDNQQEIKVKKV
ncbi:hypothetical protein QYM36_015790 [Artemia franciscana]|uniref:Reverse transcriptase domain-containing protein n=1 Tax=Artemia franciscana TaxID=6661 RepID=A0AA88HI10_ARTSF|nr:hypothetical protein QYM36_015790 [Artemia franciscana]